jgi:hypothetical protein
LAEEVVKGYVKGYVVEKWDEIKKKTQQQNAKELHDRHNQKPQILQNTHTAFKRYLGIVSVSNLLDDDGSEEAYDHGGRDSGECGDEYPPNKTGKKVGEGVEEIVQKLDAGKMSQSYVDAAKIPKSSENEEGDEKGE